MTQNFCLEESQRYIYLQVNESDVVWYRKSSAGEAFASTNRHYKAPYYEPFG
jgi:hypothetical protein